MVEIIAGDRLWGGVGRRRGCSVWLPVRVGQMVRCARCVGEGRRGRGHVGRWHRVEWVELVRPSLVCHRQSEVVTVGKRRVGLPVTHPGLGPQRFLGEISSVSL